MALRTAISERQRRLGAELRRLREDAGLSVAQASSLAGMGGPHLSHAEAGRTAAPPERIRELARIYGCTNEPYVAALVSLSESSGKGWWSPFKDVLPSSALDLAELEAEATRLCSYESLFIPGLFQTEEYARAIFSVSEAFSAPDGVETAVRFRMSRQAVLTDRNPPAVHAVIHQAALHMRFGGSEVMRRQLRRLVEVAALPHVTVQVLPFTAEGVSAVNTPFCLITSHGGHLDTVLMDHPAAQSLYMHGADQTAQYRRQFERLRSVALPPVDTGVTPLDHDPRDSLGLIQYVLYGL